MAPRYFRKGVHALDTSGHSRYIGAMDTWPLRLGKFLFRYRSFTPLPLILLTFLFFKPLSPAPFWTWAGLALAFLGEGVRIASVGFAGSGTSGRECYLKADSLNLAGLYSLVRNPLYWGNVLIFAGLLTAFTHPLALALFVLFLFLQYHFIVLAEEAFLKERHGQAYKEYCLRVNRWLPRFDCWLPLTGPFSWKKVLFKENDSCFNLLLAFLLIVAWKERHFLQKVLHPVWLAGAGLLLAALYAGLKLAKRKHPDFSGTRDF
jgi:protein-S-isoprenylcysteine O-methyltransferase Ste14